jgi:hypothetical protein
MRLIFAVIMLLTRKSLAFEPSLKFCLLVSNEAVDVFNALVERGVGQVGPGVEEVWLDHGSGVDVELEEGALELLSVA